VHIHWRRSGVALAAQSEAWELSISIVRLHADVHAIDGLVWCISVNDCVFIGITLSPAGAAWGDEALADIAEEAFRRQTLTNFPMLWLTGVAAFCVRS
jgi:hypothetical protein